MAIDVQPAPERLLNSSASSMTSSPGLASGRLPFRMPCCACGYQLPKLGTYSIELRLLPAERSSSALSLCCCIDCFKTRIGASTPEQENKVLLT